MECVNKNKLFPVLRKDVKMALHLTRLEENRKTMNKGEVEWQMLGQIVYLLPNLKREKKSGGREKKERQRQRYKTIYTWGILVDASGIVDAYPPKNIHCKCSIICFTPPLLARVDNSLLAGCLTFLTVRYFSVWLQLFKTNLMLSSVSEWTGLVKMLRKYNVNI